MMIGDVTGYVNVPIDPDEYKSRRAQMLRSGWRVGWIAAREGFKCECGSTFAVSVSYYLGEKPIADECTFDVCVICDRVNEVKPVFDESDDDSEFWADREFYANVDAFNERVDNLIRMQHYGSKPYPRLVTPHEALKHADNPDATFWRVSFWDNLPSGYTEFEFDPDDKHILLHEEPEYVASQLYEDDLIVMRGVDLPEGVNVWILHEMPLKDFKAKPLTPHQQYKKLCGLMRREARAKHEFHVRESVSFEHVMNVLQDVENFTQTTTKAIYMAALQTYKSRSALRPAPVGKYLKLMQSKV